MAMLRWMMGSVNFQGKRFRDVVTNGEEFAAELGFLRPTREKIAISSRSWSREKIRSGDRQDSVGFDGFSGDQSLSDSVYYAYRREPTLTGAMAVLS